MYFIAWNFRGMKISRIRGRGRKTAKLKCHEKWFFLFNREIKMHEKIRFFFDYVTKIHKKSRGHWWWRWCEVFEPDRNFLDAFSWFNFFLKENIVENLTKTPYFLFVIKKDRLIKMLWNLHFGFNREIKMSWNAIFGKKTAKLKWPRNFHAAKFSCNKVVNILFSCFFSEHYKTIRRNALKSCHLIKEILWT